MARTAVPRERRGLLHPALAASAACVALLTLVLASAALLRVPLGSSTTLDFSAFYTAGYLVGQGAGDRLYDIELQEAVQRDVSGSNYDEPLPFAAPAFVAVAFEPLTVFPMRGAFALWLGANCALLALVVAGLRRLMPDVPARPRALALATAAVSLPAVAVLTAGQIDLVVVAALIGGALLLRGGRPVLAGVVLALALAKPQLALGALLLLAFTSQWRALGAALVTGAALALAPIAAIGVEAVAGNIGALDAVGRANMMANWRGFLTSAGAPDEPWVWGPGWAAITAGALFLAGRAWRDPASPDEQRWALALLLPLVASPHLHGQSLVLLMPALACYLQWQSSTAPAAPGEWGHRAEVFVLGVFVLLCARWAVTLAGLSLGVWLLGTAYVLVAVPEVLASWWRPERSPAVKVHELAA